MTVDPFLVAGQFPWLSSWQFAPGRTQLHRRDTNCKFFVSGFHLPDPCMFSFSLWLMRRFFFRGSLRFHLSGRPGSSLWMLSFFFFFP